MNVAIVTAQEQRWARFDSVLTKNGHQTHYAQALSAVLEKLDEQLDAYQAVIFDDMDNADTLFAAAAAVMQRNVRIHQACRWLGKAEDFHGAGEGLGMLPAIAVDCDEKAAQAFLADIQTVSNLMQR